MGTTYKVKCQCGYETGVGAGSGRMLAREHKYKFPALCRTCGKIGTSIFGAPDPFCSHCQSTNIVRYDDPQLRKADENPLFTNAQIDQEFRRGIDLTEGIYFCPVCKEFGLRFEGTGLIVC